eukprot:1173424-Prorocentrum_minimum.AAC.2
MGGLHPNRPLTSESRYWLRQDDRAAKMETLAKLEAQQKTLKAEFDQFKENDPAYFESLSESRRP